MDGFFGWLLLDVMLTGQQSEQIWHVLVRNSNKRLLERILLFELNERLDQITSANNYNDVIFDLVAWANDNAKVVELVTAVSKRLPHNSEIAELRLEVERWQTEDAEAFKAQVALIQTPEQVLSDIRQQLLVAKSEHELRSLQHQVEKFLAHDPHRAEAKNLKEDIRRARQWSYQFQSFPPPSAPGGAHSNAQLPKTEIHPARVRRQIKPIYIVVLVLLTVLAATLFWMFGPQ